MGQYVDQQIENIKKLLSNWRHRFLSPFGKITVIKSLALSKITHLALILDIFDQKISDQLNSIFIQLIQILIEEKDKKVRENRKSEGKPGER